jgi:nitronate monooxygenase
MNASESFIKKLRIQHPIIQAPMAGGATTPELVAAVSNFGGLGSLGAGYMQPEEIRTAIKKIRMLTTKPFAVNLFIPHKTHTTPKKMQRACERIENACRELNLTINHASPPYLPNFEDQMRVILEEVIPVFSFTFGVLDPNWIRSLQKKGIMLIGTATNTMEGGLLKDAGIDLIVGQGKEAGGHRGTFIGAAEDSLTHTASLLTQLKTEIPLPIISAGGVMNAKGVAALLQQGAEAVQIGSAFLTCIESGIHASYKKVLLSQTKDETVLTTAFSGKLARGVRNQFIDRMSAHQEDILDYPIQNALTSPMRKTASLQQNTDFMSMWAGQFSYECRELSVMGLMSALVEGR